MELQDQLKSDWSRYFCDWPPLEFDTSSNHHLLCSELKSSPVRPEGDSDPYCSIWKDAERARVKNCNNRSFALDARMRLDSLKSGCNSRLPCNVMGGMLHNYNCQKDLWDSDESQEEESALDLVELLDVEDDVKDEENWLYESPKKQVSVDSTESALAWSRHILDNPSPDMEAACRSLITRLDQRSSSHFYRHPADFQRSCSVSVGSSLEKTTVSMTHNTSDSTATSPGRTRSPLRTSLRSLQAVRNSRSLETDDYQPADSQITYPPSGASSVRKQSSCWSPSLSAASINSRGSSHSSRDSSDRTAAVKRLQRSQSVSPCRIPHPAKGYLSVHGRIFASPERSTTVAWARNVPSTQR
ncbi:uncharacterized protein LOC143332485 isoform X2 [Chaetodon auriga]|uniref:uncharacterized protein LOC143332485 isoform X2 n=1 Tax=Chaetodon auriga TaxID=39042 RepID=UPI004032EE05